MTTPVKNNGLSNSPIKQNSDTTNQSAKHLSSALTTVQNTVNTVGLNPVKQAVSMQVALGRGITVVTQRPEVEVTKPTVWMSKTQPGKIALMLPGEAQIRTFSNLPQLQHALPHIQVASMQAALGSGVTVVQQRPEGEVTKPTVWMSKTQPGKIALMRPGEVKIRTFSNLPQLQNALPSTQRSFMQLPLESGFSSIEGQLVQIVDPGKLPGFIEKHFGQQAATSVAAKFGHRIATSNDYVHLEDILSIRDFLKSYPVLSKQAQVPKKSTRTHHRNKSLQQHSQALKQQAPVMPDKNKLSQQQKAATTIQNAFRKHLNELRAKKPNSMGYVEKEYRDDKTQKKGKTFFFHMDPKNPRFTDERVIYRPATAPVIPSEGNFKIVDRQDSRFVSLINKNAGENFKQDAKVNNKDLEGLSTIVAGKVVRENMMVIPNAGIPTLDETSGHRSSLLYAPLSTFKKLANDMAIAHKKGTRFLDTKPANITYYKRPGEKTGEMRLIDVADRMSKTSAYDRFVADRITHTKGLKQAWQNAPTLERRLDVLAVCDNYALLIAMIQISSSNVNLRTAVKNSVYKQVDSAPGGIYPGAMHLGNNHLFMEWIDEHVQPGFRDDVVRLLTNPADFSTSVNSRRPLADMIMFES